MGLILPFIQAGLFRVQPTKKKPGKGKRQQSSFSSPMHERKRRGNSQDGQKGTISENFSPGEEERGEEEKRGDAAQREEGEGWRRDGNSIFERKQWMIFNQRREGESRERRAGGKARSVCGSENMGFSEEEEEEEEEESSSLIRRYSNIRGHLIPPLPRLSPFLLEGLSSSSSFRSGERTSAMRKSFCYGFFFLSSHPPPSSN